MFCLYSNLTQQKLAKQCYYHPFLLQTPNKYWHLPPAKGKALYMSWFFMMLCQMQIIQRSVGKWIWTMDYKLLCLSIEYHDWVSSTPASYLGSPRFTSWPRDWLSWQVFHGDPLSLQANVGLVPQIRLLPLPSTSFSIHYLLIIQPIWFYMVLAPDSIIK